MVQNKAVFCLEVFIYKHLQIWRHNYVISCNNIVRIYRSLGIFTAILV